MLIELKIYLSLDEYGILEEAAKTAGDRPADFIHRVMKEIDEIVVKGDRPRHIPFLKQLNAEGNYAG